LLIPDGLAQIMVTQVTAAIPLGRRAGL